MNREIVESPRFARAVRRYTARNRRRQECVAETLVLMGEDAFAPRLKTHRLAGGLAGYYACSCGYDCRIVFTLEKHGRSGSEVIVLHDVGTHDEVY
jgi:mRNA-degrading endonuclease YafQ of YafQ-DinJ toxin-antitoxin module